MLLSEFGSFFFRFFKSKCSHQGSSSLGLSDCATRTRRSPTVTVMPATRPRSRPTPPPPRALLHSAFTSPYNTRVPSVAVAASASMLALSLADPAASTPDYQYYRRTVRTCAGRAEPHSESAFPGWACGLYFLRECDFQLPCGWARGGSIRHWHSPERAAQSESERERERERERESVRVDASRRSSPIFHLLLLARVEICLSPGNVVIRPRGSRIE
jgi:hypothetical protein